MQPLRSFPWAGRGWMLLVLFLLLPALSSAEPLRVMTYNILNYPGANGSGREPAMRSVINQIQPDLVVCQEVQGSSAANQFLNNVLDVLNPGEWALATFTASPDTDRACFYRTARLDLQGSVVLPTALRDINGWFFRPDGTTGDMDFRIYTLHLKASQGSSNENQRLAEATILRNHLNALPSDTHIMVLGDYNIYESSEPAWGKLTGSEADNDGQLFDPINRVGDWHDNASFADVHTQSPRTTNQGDGGATGGMDDRFDMGLLNDDMLDLTGLDYMVGTYTAYGQDGNHFNTAINNGPNSAVPDSIADALHDASDHLPVFFDVDIPNANPPIMVTSGDMNFGSVIVNAVGVQKPVIIENQAMAPANNLNYATSIGTGFTVPPAPGPLATGDSDTLQVSLDTATVGARLANLIITGDDPSNAADTLVATGTVLAHARPSVDQVTETLTASLFLGSGQQGTFSDSTVSVFNFLYGPTQAQLEIHDFVVTGADSTHFTLVGFTPQTIDGTPGSITVRFDDSNVTPFTSYLATLTLNTRDDQALAGAIDLSDLTWSLVAFVTDLATDVPQVVRPTQLHANAPNPFNPMTTLSFDLDRASQVQLTVYDSRGRRVRTLLQEARSAGAHRVVWDGQDDVGRSLASGVYFARLRTPQFEQTRRMTLVR